MIWALLCSAGLWIIYRWRSYAPAALFVDMQMLLTCRAVIQS